MKTCFSIMPFGDGFRDIDRIIREAAKQSNLKYVRGDLSKRSGSILAQIITEIRHASVVVADVTGDNPNVFYELGIAHQILGPDRVVLITQSVREKKPYDIHQFRQLVYSHNDQGRATLLAELPERLKEAAESAADQENWKVIRGKLARTEMIAGDLKKLIDTVKKGSLKGVSIRVAAAMSSLAISDLEPPDPHLGEQYYNALLAERNALREALVRGARLKAVLNPPAWRFTKEKLPERIRVRFQRLIGLLEGRSDISRKSSEAEKDVKAIRQCQFALSTVPMPNIFIIGESVAYEGLKRAGEGGFEMTHCETNPAALQKMIEQFDDFFKGSYAETQREYPKHPSLAKKLREFCEGISPCQNPTK